MTKTPWTPGPWETVTEYLEIYADIDGKMICIGKANANQLDGGFAEAVANLSVMRAAPELAEALAGALDSLRFAHTELVARGLIPGEDAELLAERIESARAALAKARGED